MIIGNSMSTIAFSLERLFGDLKKRNRPVMDAFWYTSLRPSYVMPPVTATHELVDDITCLELSLKDCRARTNTDL